MLMFFYSLFFYSFTYLFIYSSTHLFIYSFPYFFISSFLHFFIHLFIHLFIYLFIHSFIYSFIHLFIYSFIYSFIHLFISHLFIYSFIHLLIYSFIHLFIYSFIHLSIYLFIHLFMYLLIHAFIMHSFTRSFLRRITGILLIVLKDWKKWVDWWPLVQPGGLDNWCVMGSIPFPCRHPGPGERAGQGPHGIFFRPYLAAIPWIRISRSKDHEMLIQCWLSVGPPSQTVDQHSTNIGSASRIRIRSGQVCIDAGPASATLARHWTNVSFCPSGSRFVSICSGGRHKTQLFQQTQ